MDTVSREKRSEIMARIRSRVMKYINLEKYGNNQAIRKKYYTPESIVHPAKMDIPLTRWILEHYVEEGDVVLDPMAGIGTTLIEGMRMFRNCLFIGVEYEQKFVAMTNANIQKIEEAASQDMFMQIGEAICVQGDARHLPKVLCDKIITSPPFASAEHHKEHGLKDLSGEGFKGRKSWAEREHIRTDPSNLGNIKEYGKIDKIVTSPPFITGTKHDTSPSRRKLVKQHKGSFKEFEETKGSIQEIADRKSYGQVDKIITSPPFGGQVQHKTNYLGRQKRESGFEYSDDPNNLGNLPHGQVDKIISSPPFAEQPPSSRTEHGILNHPENCGCNFCKKNKGNMGELQGYRRNYMKVDKIITSPPFGVVESKRPGAGEDRQKYSYGSKLKYMAETKGNIDDLSERHYGEVDKIVSSPPFAQAQSGRGIAKGRYRSRPDLGPNWVGKHSYMPENIGDKDNISNLKYGQVDKIISSPPYSESVTTRKDRESATSEKLGGKRREKIFR